MHSLFQCSSTNCHVPVTALVSSMFSKCAFQSCSKIRRWLPTKIEKEITNTKSFLFGVVQINLISTDVHQLSSYHPHSQLCMALPTTHVKRSTNSSEENNLLALWVHSRKYLPVTFKGTVKSSIFLKLCFNHFMETTPGLQVEWCNLQPEETLLIFKVDKIRYHKLYRVILFIDPCSTRSQGRI